MPLRRPPKMALDMPVDDDDNEVQDLSKGPAKQTAQNLGGGHMLTATMSLDVGDFKVRKDGLLPGEQMRSGDTGSSDVTFDDLDRKKQLGAGATSKVYLAVHKTTGEKFALKELTVMADKDLRSMAVNELRLAHAAANGDHLVQFKNAFFNEGKICICMEFADAGSLDDVIQRGVGGSPGVPEPMTGVMVVQALLGLMYLHREVKQMHRDLKPANVMLTRAGVVKLSDFGISKQLETTSATAEAGSSTSSASSAPPSCTYKRRAALLQDLVPLAVPGGAAAARRGRRSVQRVELVDESAPLALLQLLITHPDHSFPL